MMGLRPGEVDPRAERLGGRILAGVGLTGLGICTIIAAALPHGEPAQWRLTLVFVAVTAAWILTIVPLFPRRHRRPWLTAVFFLGLLAGAAVLGSRVETFTAFASVGYPIAFSIFTARWSIFAVTATAMVPMMSRGGWGPDATTPAWVVVMSVIGPMLFVAWFVGVENDRRKRANAELAEANARLETAMEENAGLQAQLLTQAREAGVLDERQRMAREIHDTLAQGLTGIVTQLQAADRATSEASRERHLTQVHTLAKDSLTEARRAVQALRPEPLADSRLPEALADLARRVTDTSGVAVAAETSGEARPLLPELEVTLYRVAQEALANAEKHARASRIGVTLTYADDVVLLDVRDDGAGFTPGEPARGDGTGFGLQAMRQRVRRVAGTLAIESAPGEGTAVNVQVPAIPLVRDP
ncbi:sensor histidine kinase [Amycolatopsis saalfeldensis]|uniref:Oxygen sensor histidine kinase NreB n=1 Tax=Amycolatopsis saalfeldensis TaxID=394193 RepID=A0A1H8YKH5_9PSEU|nr:sensor histidine kinase [Amycolatopsis saalfeldensis]SEP51898.1 Histidine kinase-, DNA gyrase B-, and HSP90-like ATPase [Amycolatopsis saalfeldensis]